MSDNAKASGLPHNIWLAAVGVILILVAVAMKGATLTVHSFAQGFIKELGVAFIIAWLVSAGIEKQARERDAKESEERRRLIAEDVVHGVFGLRHAPAYVKAVIETNLQPNIVRDFFKATHRLTRLTEEQVAELAVAPDRFAMLRMTSTFRFRNLSTQDQPLDIRYSLPIRHGHRLRTFARVCQAHIGGTELGQAMIDQAAQEVGDSKVYSWPRSIKAGATLDVVVEAVTIKEMSDSEVFGFFLPVTDRTEFDLHVLPGMRFGVRSLTASRCDRIHQSQDAGTGSWKIDGPVLSNDSVVLWWRTPEDDGAG